MELNKKKLLIFIDWFTPGYKGGGPIQSVFNLVNAIKGDIDIRIVTRDTDFGETIPYSSISSNQWINFEAGFAVMYLSSNNFSIRKLKEIIIKENPDHIYLNGMFSLHFTIFPLLIINLIRPRAQITLAPRGMLYESALDKKGIKKGIYLIAFKWLYNYGKLKFHATNEKEAIAIRRRFASKIIVIANNLPFQRQNAFTTLKKDVGALKCVFVARIDPIKNLLHLLQILKKSEANVDLAICGPIEDMNYWELCRNEIGRLPENIKIEIVGPIEPNKVLEVIRKAHLYILLSKGENFGHSIFESFISGRPVLISDQTPWKNLIENKTGADISLNDISLIKKFVEDAAQWTQKDFDVWAYSSWFFAKSYLMKDTNRKLYLDFFG